MELTTTLLLIAVIPSILFLGGLGMMVWQQNRRANPTPELLTRLHEYEGTQHELHDRLMRLLLEQRQQLGDNQLNHLKTLTESLQNSFQDVRFQMTTTLKEHASILDQRVEKFTVVTDQKLHEVSSRVEQHLTSGLEKTTLTFTDIVKRLALIDEAQKKITELSSHVVNLQEILTDKRARGAFGEVQLSALLHDLLPPDSFTLQATLSNGKRADCLLSLPAPTGKIAIDAKFPLENYQKLANPQLSEPERREARQQFRQDVKKHLQDIAEKYIISGETADGAIMFIPAEAIFAEIHANHPELVDFSYRSRVWLTSPTTLMAILSTARTVLRDSATREKMDVIQNHLVALGQDFTRFQNRMDQLSKHILQVHTDIEDVHRSAKKISGRFKQIEQAEINSNLPGND